jgi:hypothetical protein
MRYELHGLFAATVSASPTRDIASRRCSPSPPRPASLCNKDLPENNLLYFHAARYNGGSLVDRYPYPSWNIT